MSEKKRAEETTAGASAPAAPTTFTIERLRKDCLELFGVTFSTYDGAVYGLSGEFTVEEMRNCIKKWQSKGISAPKTDKKEAK